jgi:hypothetical protein
MALSRTLYPSTNRTEIDLRKELEGLFHGNSTEIAKAQTFLFRRMRRDENNNLTKCECVDELTQEPDLDTECVYCQGEGYYWDEELAQGRKVHIGTDASSFTSRNKYQDAGILNTQAAVFYFEHDLSPTLYDRIIEISLDNEGDLVVPYLRRKIYRAHTVYDYRSDTGRVEFWGIFCTEKDAILIETGYNK